MTMKQSKEKFDFKAFGQAIKAARNTAMFLNSTSYTENCYECKYAKTERISDLTLGDSWGSRLTEDEIHKGVSLALCQTEKK